MYDKILKELKKGNSVMVEVKGVTSFQHKFRVVTPSNCHFNWMVGGPPEMPQSCFIENKIALTPEFIIDKMKSYDKNRKQRVVKMQVL